MDKNTSYKIQALVDEIHEQKKRIEKIERSSDLAHSAIDRGGITIMGENGPAAYIGPNPNGVVTTRYAKGPVPNQPSAPTVEAGVGSVSITWDGRDAAGNKAPDDFRALNIYTSLEPEFEPDEGNFLGVIPTAEGGTKSVAMPYGAHYIRTSLVTLSDVTGPASDAVLADVLSVVELPDVADEFAQGRADLEALDGKLTQADADLADARARIESAENQLIDLGLTDTAIQERLDTAEAEIAQTAKESSDAISDLNIRLTDANTDLAAAEARLAQAESQVTQLGLTDQEISDRLAEAEELLASGDLASEELDALEEKLRQEFTQADADTLSSAEAIAITKAGGAEATAIAEAQRLADAAKDSAITAAEADATAKADQALADAKADALSVAKAEAQAQADEAEAAAKAYADAQAAGASDEALAQAKAYADAEADEALKAAEAFATAEAEAKASAAQAEATRIAAEDAQKKADAAKADAQEFADGLPKVLHGTTPPTGTAPNGSVWFQHQGSISGQVIGQWVMASGKWTSTPISSEAIANLDVGKLTAGSAVINEAVLNKVWSELGVFGRLTAGEAWIGRTQIKDGEITTEKITVTDELVTRILGAEEVVTDVLTVNENLWAEAAQILKLDVSNLIVTGTSTLNDLVAKQIFTDIFRANKITTSQLAIEPGNLFPDPTFETGTYPNWTVVNEGLEKYGTGTQQGGYTDNVLNVKPGDALRFEATRTTLEGPSDNQATIHYQKRASATDPWAYGGAALIMRGDGRHSRELVVPEGVGQIRLSFTSEASVPTTTKIRIEDVRIQSMTTGVLLRDGSVTANHIVASDSLTTKVLAAESAVVDVLKVNTNLWAEAAQIIKLDVSNLIVTEGATIDEAVIEKIWSEMLVTDRLTAGEAWIGETVIKDGAITAPKVRADAIETSHIKAGAVDATKIDADAVTADHLAAKAVKAEHLDFVSSDMASGGSMSMDASGITLSRDGSTVLQITNKSVETVALSDADGNQVASISNDGSVVGALGSFDELMVQGMSVQEQFDAAPRGLIATAVRDNISGVNPSTTTSHQQAYMRLDFEARAGYSYEVTADGLMITASEPGSAARGVFIMRANTDGTIVQMNSGSRAFAPTSTTTSDYAQSAATSLNWVHHATQDGMVSVLVSYRKLGGPGTVRAFNASWAPSLLKVVETSTVEPTGKVDYVGTVSVGTDPVDSAPAQRRVTQTWTANATQSWRNTSMYTSPSYPGNHLWQGVWSGDPNGVKKGHAVFTAPGSKGETLGQARSKIQKLERLEVYMYCGMAYDKNGLTVRLHRHGSTAWSSYPSLTFLGDHKFNRGQGRWIEITDAAAKQAFVNGTFTGFAIDPRGSSSHGYYGYMRGVGSGTKTPKIRATYLTT